MGQTVPIVPVSVCGTGAGWGTVAAMRRLLNTWAYLVNFFWEVVGFYLFTKPKVIPAVTYIATVVLWAIAVKASEWTLTVRIESSAGGVRSMTDNGVQLIGIVAAIGSLIAAIGFAVGRAFSARVVFSDRLEPSPGNHSLWLEVSCKGFGVIKPTVSVEEIRDSLGIPVDPTEVNGLPLSWTHGTAGSDEQLRDGGRRRTVNVFYYPRGVLALNGRSRELPLAVGKLDRPEMVRLAIRLRAEDDRCDTVLSDWYWIEWRDGAYHPCLPPSPLPAAFTPPGTG